MERSGKVVDAVRKAMKHRGHEGDVAGCSKCNGGQMNEGGMIEDSSLLDSQDSSYSAPDNDDFLSDPYDQVDAEENPLFDSVPEVDSKGKVREIVKSMRIKRVSR